MECINYCNEHFNISNSDDVILSEYTPKENAELENHYINWKAAKSGINNLKIMF